MNLSRATLAKIYLSFHPTWYDENTILSESDDGGVIYLRHSPSMGLLIIAALRKEKGDVPLEKMYDILPRCTSCAGYLVLAYDIISPSILLRLLELENRQQEGGFRICVVADVGKDSSTGEMKYSYRGFDDVEELTKLIKGELVAQGSQTDLDPYSIPAFKMRAAIRNYLVNSGHKGVTLRQVNEGIRGIKKCPFPTHFEDLVGEQRARVVDTIIGLSLDGLTVDEAKSKTIDIYGIADCDILQKFITDIQSTKER